jgi:hypothetical protein
MCLRRAPEKYIAGAKAPAGAALDRAVLEDFTRDEVVASGSFGRKVFDDCLSFGLFESVEGGSNW